MAMTINGTSGLTFPDTSTQGKSAANGQTGSAPFYSARAWVNFNGSGTVAIRASGNVTSITDNGTGDYTANFTNAMPDTNYVVICGAPRGGGSTAGIGADTYATNSIRVQHNTSGGNSDTAYANVAVFR